MPGLTSRERQLQLADPEITTEECLLKAALLTLFAICSGCCGDDNLPFRVEIWDDTDRHIEELIALVSDYSTVVVTYEEVV